MNSKTIKAGTIDEYIAGFPKDVQDLLQKVRLTIRAAAPEAEEAISYAMPTFKLNGNLVHFAAFQNHIGFYPTPSGIEEFKKELSVYKQGKGSVQFPLDKPIPFSLITRIVKFRTKKNKEKANNKSQKKNQMRKLVLYIHTSLDGYATNSEGTLDWVHVDEEIFDYGAQRTNESDTALYGRVTYQLMESYWPTATDQPDASKHDKEHAAWYKTVNKVILSKSIQGTGAKNTTIISDDLQKHILDLKQKEGKEIIIFGSPTAAHSLMQFDLIDDYWLFVNPILLGKGIRVFENISEIKKLKLIAEHAFSSGVVCLNYERERKSI